MQKTYCPSCGSKIEYSGEKPRFCSSCGEELSSLKSPRRNSLSQASAGQGGRDDETDSSHVPKIDGIEYEVEYSNELRKITFDDLRDNGEEPPRRRK